jgi:hypothetical protein
MRFRAMFVPILALSTLQAPAGEDRVARLNAAFLDHLNTLPVERTLAVETIRSGWRELYENKSPGTFVPDAVAVLHPEYAAALKAFDERRNDDAIRILKPLIESEDEFLGANAGYFYVRTLLDQGLLEEAEKVLVGLVAQNQDGRTLAEFTPYAPHLHFMLAVCQARNLRREEAQKSLAALGERYSDAPEPVRVGARQLALELERRESGNLADVVDLMNYSAERLRVADAGERVRSRQDEAVTLLDKMIEEAEQNEQQQASASAGGNRQGRGGDIPQGAPSQPRDESRVDPGQGEIGDLHAAPRANPGDMWGRLPPAERERILQSLRDRFPSRYRQLVEQYYRSLAEHE